MRAVALLAEGAGTQWDAIVVEALLAHLSDLSVGVPTLLAIAPAAAA